MFKQLIALNTYTEPFLSLKANDQRAMIEQLLGITELSQKADILKEKLKDTRDNIKEEEIRITAVKNSNERVERNIKEIESRSKAWNKTKEDKVADLQASIDSLEEIDIEQELVAHNSNSVRKEQTDACDTLSSELERISTSLQRSKNKLGELRSNLADARTVCRHVVKHSTPRTHEYTEELMIKITEEEKYHDELHDRSTDIETALEEFTDIPEEMDTFYNTLEDALSHKHNLDTLQSQLEEKITELNPYDEQVQALKDTGLEEISFDAINEFTNLKDHQEFLYKLLTSKDSFIRKRIIDQNIAYLNHRLAYYLDKIGLPHDVKFSSDLGVEITEYGRDLDFDNLSRGERNRLILSLSWAFRDIWV